MLPLLYGSMWFSSEWFIAQYVVMFAAVVGPSELVDLIIVTRNRQTIVDFLRNHNPEINLA